MSSLQQVFIDCMPGPTHHYGGHSHGNLASMQSKEQPSNPKQAALEWLNKVKKVSSLGVTQLITPPHRRPLLIHNRHHNHHQALSSLASGFMWMANSGHFFTKSDRNPSNYVFIPANMNGTKHRKHEWRFNQFWLSKMFINLSFQTYQPCHYDDEGAANTIRLWGKNMTNGFFLFVSGSPTSTFPSRQHQLSIHEIVKKSQVADYFHLTQHHTAIEHGVFHNDVISFGFSNHLFCHEYAFANQSNQLMDMYQQFESTHSLPLNIHTITNSELSLTDAVSTYLFNSQIIIHNNQTILLCPSTVADNHNALSITRKWKSKGLFNDILFINLDASLMNGGGPACLRLTLYLTDDDTQLIPKQFKLSDNLANRLEHVIKNQYPESFDINVAFNEANHMRNIVKSVEQLFL